MKTNFSNTLNATFASISNSPKFIVLVLLTIHISLATASSQESETADKLEWKYIKAQKYGLTLTQQTSATILNTNEPSSLDIKLTAYLTWLVLDELADDIELKQSLERFVIVVKTKNSEQKYDSLKNAVPPASLKKLVDKYKAASSKPAKFMLTKDGHLKVHTETLLANRQNSRQFEPATGNLLADESEVNSEIRQFINNHLLDLEFVKSTNAQETPHWNQTLSNPMDQQGKLELTIHQKQANAEEIVFDVSATMTLSDDFKQTQNVELAGQRGHGEAKFNLEYGFQSDANLRQTIQLKHTKGSSSRINVFELNSKLSIAALQSDEEFNGNE